MKHATFRPRFGHSVLLLALASSLVQAADALPTIQQQWAHCQYQETGKAKESCLATLSAQADQASAKEAFRTDLLIWSAIVKSTWAGAKGGLGALSLAKEAKAKLEIAIKQDPKALARQLPIIERHARHPVPLATDHGDNPACATHEKEH